MSSYFVDASTGSDLNSGRSEQTPWQTLAMVNSHRFKPGDKILLTGTFASQTLILGPTAKGVSVNSYLPIAAGRTVKVGTPNAVFFSDVEADGIDITTSNVTIQNITITADPAAVATGNYNYGIYLHNSTDKPLSHEIINQVAVSGFSYSGLCMQGWNTTTVNSAGFSNVLIENSSFFANQVSGIFAAAGDNTGNEFQPAFPANLYVNSNLTVRYCQAYNNAGYNSALMGTPDGVNINQGNYTSGGIFISSVNGATIENCTVYNNCFAAMGSVGTWAFDSTRVNFQNDDSYDNKTLGGDGDGFDFDHGVTHSIMQQDYSHGNEGVGFLLTTIGGAANNNGDTIRFCISDDNNGGIWVVAAVPILYANIYNNTVIGGDTPGQNTAGIAVLGDVAGTSANILNNIFLSTGTLPVVLLSAEGAAVHFDGNDYWEPNAPGDISVSEVDGSSYDSLSAWSAASGEESAGGKIIGLTKDPMLVNETVSDLPMAGVAILALSGDSPLLADGLILASRPWAGSLPFKLNAPYNLAGKAWGGLGKANYFGKRINVRETGAG